ncbi:MAG: TIGR04013 family B12-binding domain/radical SAM domain-containing protein [Planctomycetes bacterium]|nr:TIGR04013 family B12-binding domain/radical SAM domain-containing protein [Planctomycetota bacterium]
MGARLIFSYRSPGRYAFNVLAGALEDLEQPGVFELRLARTSRELAHETRSSVELGLTTVVAWSFYSPSFAECAEELHNLRDRVPNGWSALAGGVHATAEPLATLRAGFERVALGEGEHSVRALALALSDGRSLDAVRGLGRLVDGALVSSGRGEPVGELDTFPAFASRRRRFGAIEITRGCIYACKFCQTPFLAKARFRHRSPANVAHWAGEIARAGLRDVRFISPTSLSYGSRDETPNLTSVEELLCGVRSAIGRNGRLFFGTFPSEVRPEHVTHEALTLLKRHVDNDNLVIGGQSGSERVLRSSHRGHGVEVIERAVRIALEHGFRPNVDFLLGLPGEEPSDVEATLTLIGRLTELGAKAHAHTFMPLPGTPFRAAPAGGVAQSTRARLETLEGAGRLFGQWRRQEQIAARLGRERAS